MKNHKVLLNSILVLAATVRLYGLNWDQGYYLHPDERLYIRQISLPTSLTEFLSPNSPLNPNMFYYGPVPLYLSTLVNNLLFSNSNLLISSRVVSALFSILTIPLLYLIGKKLMSTKIGLIAAFLFALAPSSIQYAHFNTTESMLVFILCATLYVSIICYQNKNYSLMPLLGMLTGISYAIKITGLTVGLFPFITLFLLWLREKNAKKIVMGGFIYAVVTILTGLLLAPYQVIDFQQFYQEQSYMQAVTVGKFRPPFVIIYEHTIPYWYQLTRILPFSFGFISILIALIGMVQLFSYCIRRNVSQKRFSRLALLLFLFLYPLLYFVWSGSWYVKFTRYYLLLFPFFSLWGAYTLSKLNRTLSLILLALVLINGAVTLRLYSQKHTRVQASEWIYSQVPPDSTIACEHWDDCIPIALRNRSFVYTTESLEVYPTPDSTEKIKQLSVVLSNSDYLTLSSRRVYYSILVNDNIYPLTSHLYRLLFNGQIGYRLEKQFTNYPFFISDDSADESFQSYDHPPVLIFKNIEHLSPGTIEQRILLSPLNNAR